MKKLALGSFALVLLAAFTLVENQSTPVTLNGHPLANAVVVQGGILAISVQDLAKAAGAPVTLEPTFQLQSNRLYAREAALGGETKQKVAPAAAAPNLRYNPADEHIKKAVVGQIIAVRKGGLISSNVIMVNGKAFVPLRDVVHAFGDGSVRGFTGTTKPGAAINLNSNNNNIIGILIGL